MARLFGLLFSLFLACSLAVPALAQVGVTSVAVGQPRGTPPAQNERVLRVGVDVFANERIMTGAADRAHLVFLDGSAVTVGPSSDLVIDRFVYDPATRTGDLAMTTTRGAFRFVGGAISKKSEVTVRTPGAMVGIRGGIMTIVIGTDGSIAASFLFGERMTVSNSQGSAIAIRPGSVINVAFNGPPRQPILLPPGSFQAVLSTFESILSGAGVPNVNDEALLAALLIYLREPNGTDWITILQNLAAQGILTTNANRPTGATPPAPVQPQYQYQYGGGDGGSQN
jgi:hypothetical protein